MRRTTLIRRAAAGAAAPVLALALVACSGGSEDAAEPESSSSVSDEVVPEESAEAETVAEGEEVDREQFLADLQTGLEGVETAKMRMTMDLPGQKVTAEGQVDYTSEPPNMSMTMDNPGAQGESMDMRIVDEVVYINLGQLSGGKFIKMPTDAKNSPLGDLDELTGSMDAVDSLQGFSDGAKSVTFVGEEDVDGQELSHYRLTLDTSQVESFEGAGDDVPKEVDYDLWLDDENRIVQAKLNLGKQTGSMTVDLYDYDEPVDITAPKKSDITTMPGGRG
jgi:hypothetical protein